jgi:3-(3-hydroxy-phenyl)propionate hydroxylase
MGANKYEVIVAGGGPVGTVAAYLLARAGIEVLLLEAGASWAADLRASTFHPPTLDIMEKLGLSEALHAQGLKAPEYRYHNRRTGRIISFDLSEIADISAHPYRLQCEQWKLAGLASAKIAAEPTGTVLFSRRVVAFDQDDAGVDVHAETPTAIETYRADYVIGCDGANSIIRKWLGVEFEGFTYGEKFLCFSTDLPVENYVPNLCYVNYMADPEEWLVLLRAPTAWRVLLAASEDDPDAQLLGDAKKDAVFAKILGSDMPVETLHRTIYRVHQRVATRYRFGRVILAGDAAHLNNPLGGMGMNSGIHDVWNLGNKLIDILRNGAGDDLIDQYDRQRRTVMQEFIQAQSIQNKRAMEMADGDAAARNEDKLAETARDPALRREYIMRQSMYRSIEREAEIA